jgi:lipopolysaccharide transport system ATP-binding protein
LDTIAIRCQNLSKCYRLGGQERYLALRDTIAQTLRAPWRKIKRIITGQSGSPAEDKESLWVLQDLSFEVKYGEVMGIIGRNGAGKSTLLKILSRITEPSRGFAEIHGRVGSLLEVGTGFHQELSGRENIYFNGAILGMKRAEIRQKFDEIVQFAEVGRFIDTPVKHYSSGMYMRLAFAVAAHLEPEILLVDEVLAVGDAAFQRKCLSKMQEVGKQGRTVLFVSHNMPAVTRLCPRTILIDGGRIAFDGPSHQAVSMYLRSGLGTMSARRWTEPRRMPGDHVVRLHGVRVVDENEFSIESADIRKPVGIEMEYEVIEPGWVMSPTYYLFNEEGVVVFTTQDQDPAQRGKPRPLGRNFSTAWIPGNLLSEGTLIVTAEIRKHFFESDAVAFHVIDSMDEDTARGEKGGSIPGVVRPLLRWTNRTVESSQAAAASSTDTLEGMVDFGKEQTGVHQRI